MLQYIIDGFNLIHKIPALKDSSAVHQDLVNYIYKHKLSGSKNNKVMIVFDGAPNWRVRLLSEFEIIFALDRKADDLIKERVNKIKNKSNVIVVSDDREIREYVKKAGAKSQGIADFIKIKEPSSKDVDSKEISYPMQAQITEELRRIWIKE
jgi:predicted RNA-binding protein with PIN domain